LETDEAFSCSGDGIEEELFKENFSSSWTTGLLGFVTATAMTSLGMGRFSSSVFSVDSTASSVFTGFSSSTGLLVANDSSFSSPTETLAFIVADSVSMLSSVTGIDNTSSVLLERSGADGGKSLSVISLDGGVGNGEEMAGEQLDISFFKQSSAVCDGVHSFKGEVG
jgi:hypothetical protein